MPRHKPAKRTKDRAFQVRITDAMADQFDAMMNEFAGRVLSTSGREISRTDLVEYWIAWLLGMPQEERDRWARTYRAAFVASLDAQPEAATDGPKPTHRGPDVTLDIRQSPSDRGPAKEDDDAPKRKPTPVVSRRK